MSEPQPTITDLSTRAIEHMVQKAIANQNFDKAIILAQQLSFRAEQGEYIDLLKCQTPLFEPAQWHHILKTSHLSTLTAKNQNTKKSVPGYKPQRSIKSANMQQIALHWDQKIELVECFFEIFIMQAERVIVIGDQLYFMAKDKTYFLGDAFPLGHFTKDPDRYIYIDALSRTLAWTENKKLLVLAQFIAHKLGKDNPLVQTYLLEHISQPSTN